MTVRFKAVQLDVASGKPTGRVEHYLARGKKDAARKLLYTRRLRHGRCRLGPSGLVVSCPDGTAWILMKERKRRG